MVVDSSAIVAILRQEPEAGQFANVLEGDDQRLMSAATMTELGVVALRRGGQPLARELDRLFVEVDFVIMPVTEDRARAAIQAYATYGRAIGKPPCLNFGDCFSYALARELDAPLLYKGDDFSQTDIRSALS